LIEAAIFGRGYPISQGAKEQLLKSGDDPDRQVRVLFTALVGLEKRVVELEKAAGMQP
jgi:hypothetical protein